MTQIAIPQAATALAIALSLAAPAAAQPSAETVDAIGEHLDLYEKAAAFNGIVVISEDDEVVLESTSGQADYRFGVPITPDTRFKLGSLSKQFTQAAIGRLADQGKLDLNDRLSIHLPDYPEGDRFTLMQLIANRAGVAHTNELAWMDMNEAMSLDEIVENLAKEPLTSEPGTEYKYSNGGYALLAKVIEAASGKTFEEYLLQEFGKDYPSIGHVDGREVILGLALGYAPGLTYGKRMEAEEYLVGNRIGGGSLYASASDLLRFFRDCYEGQVVSSEITALLFKKPKDGDSLITGRSPGTFAQVYLDHTNKTYIGVLNANSSWPPRLAENIAQIYRGEEPQRARFSLAPGPVSPAVAAAAVGDYDLPAFGWNDLSLAVEGGHLIWQRGKIRSAFVPTTDGRYFLPIWDWLCRFDEKYSMLSCRSSDPQRERGFDHVKKPEVTSTAPR